MPHSVPNAIRLVDIPEALAQVLRRYTEGKDGLPLHDESWTASRPAQHTQSVARGRESRWIPRLSALSLCGTSQGRRTGEPDQTVDGPFAELDGPLRRANYGSTWLIVANGAIELVWDLSWANWAIKVWHQLARYSSRKSVLRQVLEMVAGVRFELTIFGL